MRRAPLSTSRAFTLMEVLATLVLIGVVVPVAMRGITVSMAAAQQARRTLEATELAQQKLAELLVLREANLLNESGTFGVEWPDYRWRCESTPANYGLYQIKVIVSWQHRGQEGNVTLQSLVRPSTTSESSASTSLSMEPAS